MIEIISGDLFTAQEQYIAHQCNCVTKRAAHLAKDMFAKYPYANIYKGRTQPDKPGHLIIRGNGQDQRYVVALLGQYEPGLSKDEDSELDGTKARQKYFYHSLLRLAKVSNLESIAFPWKIGCGAAGGNWEYYLGTLHNFAKYVKEQNNTRVVIYRREGDE